MFEFSEQVKLFDVKHFTHKRFRGFVEIGETVYNADNKRKPVRKYGNAPCELLSYYSQWFSLEQARNCLRLLGFKKRGAIEWER